MSFQKRTNESTTQKESYNCQQMDPIRFSHVYSRIITTTRSLRKKRIVKSAERNKVINDIFYKQELARKLAWKESTRRRGYRRLCDRDKV